MKIEKKYKLCCDKCGTRILKDKTKQDIDAKYLISNDFYSYFFGYRMFNQGLLSFSKETFVSDEVKYYIHIGGNKTTIGGGLLSEQEITTLKFKNETIKFIENTFRNTNKFINKNFIRTLDKEEALIRFYLDIEINLGGNETVLGIALQNSSSNKKWWELILNGPELEDINTLHFATVHELGHALGLEHPFDDTDDDVIGYLGGDPDTSKTVMSYTLVNPISQFFTNNDINALQTGWQKNMFSLELKKGWNLISSPNNLTKEFIENIPFINQIYTFSSNYKKVNNINKGNGYWIKCIEDGKIEIDNSYDEYPISISLNKGWNLIGGYEGIINDDKIKVYNFNLKYNNSKKLEIGKGYWVKCESDCEIYIN